MCQNHGEIVKWWNFIISSFHHAAKTQIVKWWNGEISPFHHFTIAKTPLIPNPVSVCSWWSHALTIPATTPSAVRPLLHMDSFCMRLLWVEESFLIILPAGPSKSVIVEEVTLCEAAPAPTVCTGFSSAGLNTLKNTKIDLRREKCQAVCHLVVGTREPLNPWTKFNGFFAEKQSSTVFGARVFKT